MKLPEGMRIDLNLTPAEALACEEIRRPEDMEGLREEKDEDSFR
jgi:hypothetical protein